MDALNGGREKEGGGGSARAVCAHATEGGGALVRSRARAVRLAVRVPPAHRLPSRRIGRWKGIPEERTASLCAHVFRIILHCILYIMSYVYYIPLHFVYT